MQNRTMLVLDEGSCPFMGDGYYACCYTNLMFLR